MENTAEATSLWSSFLWSLSVFHIYSSNPFLQTYAPNCMFRCDNFCFSAVRLKGIGNQSLKKHKILHCHVSLQVYGHPTASLSVVSLFPVYRNGPNMSGILFLGMGGMIIDARPVAGTTDSNNCNIEILLFICPLLNNVEVL